MVAAVCLAVTLIQPPILGSTLPPTWHGAWVGLLKIIPEVGEARETPMTLEIVPIRESRRFTFRLMYGLGDTAQVRDYELVPVPDKKGQFEIDEKNGIKLEAKLVGDILYATFKVGDSLIQSRYERSGETLRVEMVAVSTKDAKTTRPTAGGAEVKTYPIIAVQTAALKRLPKK